MYNQNNHDASLYIRGINERRNNQETLINNKQINNIYTQKSIKNSLKIVHWNCNAIMNKIEDLITFINSVNPDIICLNEIKCSINQGYEAFNKISNYKYILKTRDSNKGGGVAIIIKNNIDAEEISIPVNCEIAGIQIVINNQKTAIFSLYNPPTETLKVDLFRFIENKYKNYLIVGDLNAKLGLLGNNSNINGKILDEILLDINGCILNNLDEATHVRISHVQDKFEVSADILDYMIGSPVFASTLKYCTTNSNSVLHGHHYPLVAEFQLKREIYVEAGTKKRVFMYEKANWCRFKAELEKTMIQDAENLSVEDLNKTICEKINEAASVSIPVKEIKRYRNNPLPESIVFLRKMRNKMYQRYKKIRSVENMENYYAIRWLFEERLREFRDSKWQRFLNRLGSSQLSTKPFWQRIARMRGKAQSSNNIPSLINNNIEIKTNADKAALFSRRLIDTFSENKEDSARFDDNFKKSR